MYMVFLSKGELSTDGAAIDDKEGLKTLADLKFRAHMPHASMRRFPKFNPEVKILRISSMTLLVINLDTY